MEEVQYREICKTCDEILVDDSSGIACTAIPFLHIIREHPVFLSNYKLLFNGVSGFKTIVQDLNLIARSIAGLIKRLLFFKKKYFWETCTNIKGSQFDLIIVSHLISETHADKNHDFYFGNIPNELISKGNSVLLVLMNHTGKNAKDLAKKWQGNKVPAVILSDSLGMFKELGLVWSVLKEAIRLKKYSFNQRLLKGKLLSRASVEVLSGRTISTLRVYWQLRSIVSLAKPKAILVTFEGHAWERLAFAAARSEVPGCNCMAYQHAAIFKLQHAIRRKLKPQYNPDFIFTSGTVSRDQLVYSSDFSESQVLVLGSDRGINEIKVPESIEMRSTDPNRHACLVLPEGIESECILLFNFALECAINCPDLVFIWRLHPILSFKTLIDKNPGLRNLPPNITLSSDSIETDFTVSKWVLYRGTTAVVKAIGEGIKPVYLAFESEMTIDPLYELNEWHESVLNPNEMKALLYADNDKTNSKFFSGYEGARNYCRNFYKPVSVTSLSSTIKSESI
uniref:hypothetical protein n=1 Tax=Algoriphagus sp. TaxID=1872435 RepID=UPI004048E949